MMDLSAIGPKELMLSKYLHVDYYNSLQVVTPKRVYYLMALNDSDRSNWMAAIRTAISSFVQ